MLAASSNLSNFIQVVVSLEKACSAFFIAGPGRKQACRCACLLPPAYIARSCLHFSLLPDPVNELAGWMLSLLYTCTGGYRRTP